MKAIKARDALMRFFGFFSKDGNPFYIEFNFDTGKWETNIGWMASIFEKNLINKFPKWSKTITALFANAKGIWSSLKQLWIDIKDAVNLALDPLKEFFAQKFSDEKVAQWITDLPDNIEWLGDTIKRWAPTIGTFFSGIAELIGSVTENVNFKDLVNNITDLVEALNPFLDLLGKGFSSKMGRIVGKAGSALSKVLESTADAINNADPAKIEALGEFLADLVILLPIIAPIANGFTLFSDSLLDLVNTAALFSMSGGFEGLFAGLSAGTGGALAGSVGAIAGIAGAIITVIAVCAHLISTTDSLKTLWEGVWGQIVSVATTAWEGGLKPMFSGLMGTLSLLWNGILEPIFALVLTVGLPLLEMTISALGLVVVVLSAMANAVLTVVNVVVLLVTWIVQFITALGTSIVAIADFISALTSGDWSTAIAGLKENMGGIWSAFSQNTKSASKEFKDSTGSMWSEFGKAAEPQILNSLVGLGILVKKEGTNARSDFDKGFATSAVKPDVLKGMIDAPRIAKDATTAGTTAGTKFSEGLSSALTTTPITLDSEEMSASAFTAGTTVATQFAAGFGSIDVATPIIATLSTLPELFKNSVITNMTSAWQAMVNIMYGKALVMTANVATALDHMVYDTSANVGTAVATIQGLLNSIPRDITIHIKIAIEKVFVNNNGKNPDDTKWLASGGIANRGDVFVANERGPEYITSLGGGKSGIMNNQQMADVIAAAVYKATYEANVATGRGDVVVNAELKTSDRTIARSANRGNLVTGYKLHTQGG
jgi:hypothetical protein